MEKTPETQSCREQNIQAIVDYLASGADARSTSVGIELEHQILSANGGKRVPYSGENGIESLLEKLSAQWDEKVFENDHLIGLSRVADGIQETVTLEPGGQVELSCGPFSDTSVALEFLDEFEDELKDALKGTDQMAVLMGYPPVDAAADIELAPKKRYEIMDKHFTEIGGYGTCMMRGSAATQVSIDYADEADMARKLRLATAASPIIAMMCDNTVMFEGELREHYLVRTEIWNGTDQARCGVVPGVMEDGFTFAKYAEWILDTPAVVAMDADGNQTADERTFGEIFADTPMTEADVKHALSMVFPDVRLNKYIELRSADALPTKYAAALAALIKGCFYTKEALDELENLLGKVKARDIPLAKLSLMNEGYEAQVYGKKAWQLAEKMNVIAKTHLTREEREILEPLTTYAFTHVTLAEMTVFE